MFLRYLGRIVVALVTLSTLAIGGSGTAGAFQDDDECRRCTRGETGPSADSLFATWTGSGPGRTGGNKSNCSYQWVSFAAGPGDYNPDGFQTGGDVGPFLVGAEGDQVLIVILRWSCSDVDLSGCDRLETVRGDWTSGDPHRVRYDCDGDGFADGEEGIAVNELADVEGLLVGAFDALPWPDMEIMTTPEEEGKVISGFDIPLRLEGPATFETEIIADASENGVVVTATATAELVTWDTGDINAFFGFGEEDTVECDTFGEPQLEANPCTVYWRSSSAGQPGDRVTLQSVVSYTIDYEINVPGIDVGEDAFELIFERPDFPVAEWQAINVFG